MKFARAWLVFGFALCMGTGAQAEECATPRLENTVRMEPIVGSGGADDGRVALPITLNGVEKKFLFDTGGGAMNYVRSDVALKLGMFQDRQFPGDGPGGKQILQRRRRAQCEVRRDLQPGGRLGLPGCAGSGLRRHPVGRNDDDDDLDMDFGAMRLNFFSADHCPGDVVYWPHPSLAVVPVSLAQGHFELAVTLDGHALTAAIDTGSSWTILDAGWAGKNLNFSAKDGVAQAPGAPKDQPEDGLYFRRYAALSFPGISIANPLVVVRPVQFGDGKDQMPRAPDLIIGMEVLRHLHLYYAANEKRLYITPAASGPSPLPKDVAPSPDGHAWPRNAELYSKVWDPIHRPH